MTTVSDVADAVFAAIAAVANCYIDPRNQIQALLPLASYTVITPAGFSATGQATAGVSAATAALIRRAALVAIATATSLWQPSTSTDAQAVIKQLVPVYDAEALYAADTGDTDSYTYLRSLRSAIVADLSARSAALPSLISVTPPAPIPSLVAAYQLYGDATREPELVERNPAIPCPLFLFPSFEATSF